MTETLCVLVEGQQQYQLSRNALSEWNLQHVGYFDPNPAASLRPGDHAIVGSETRWFIVFLFEDSILEHCLDAARRAIIQRDFGQLLRSDAQPWWAGERSLNLISN